MSRFGRVNSATLASSSGSGGEFVSVSLSELDKPDPSVPCVFEVLVLAYQSRQTFPLKQSNHTPFFSAFSHALAVSVYEVLQVLAYTLHSLCLEGDVVPATQALHPVVSQGHVWSSLDILRE